MAKVLIVVDMLNDFVHEDGVLSFPAAKDVIGYITARVEAYQERDDYVIFLADAHAEDDAEFEKFPAHALDGTWGAKLINELLAMPTVERTKEGKDVLIKKTRYSGFYGTNLEALLADIQPLQVEVVGVCTSICVMDTVGGLANRDYDIKVPEVGVADFDEDAHIAALGRMSSLYGADVVPKD